MQVNILNLQKLFASPVRYEIPLFQRPYVWNHEEQWGPLWEDVQNTAEIFLEIEEGGLSQQNLRPHFLGAVVLQQKQVSAPMFMTRLVVDGQQRLTTLQLLLDAVQEVFQEHEVQGAAKRLELLVLNHEAFCGDDPDNAFKVWPTRTDQNAFRHAMHNDLPIDEYHESRIVRAHEFFKDQTRHWLDAQPSLNESRVKALEQALTNNLELVVIDLDQSDDPHVIFETLNARGTALLQSDLVKNMVLHEAGQSGMPYEHVERRWEFGDEWWRKDIRQGRLWRPRIDVFLNYWMVMREVDEVVASDVFSVFRRYYEKKNRDIEGILTDIGRVAATYRSLEETGISKMAKFLYRWRVTQAGVITPVLLWMLSSTVPSEQLEKGIRALESYLVRRMICRMTTMGQNRVFISLVERLDKAGPQYAGNTIVEFLGNQESEVGKWPDDKRLEEALVDLPLYRLLTRGRLRLVLEGIEENLRADKAEIQDAPRNLTIEHIMPRGWRHHWRDPYADAEGLDKEEQLELVRKRDHVIHTIGNLTLVTKRLNTKLSNAPWDSKQKTLGESSVLFLNKVLLDNPAEEWNECVIEERSKKLSRIVAEVWPYADKI